MTEDELLREVQKLAKLNGWLFAHFRPARTQKGWRTLMQGDRGFIDCVLAKHIHQYPRNSDPQVLHLELKSEGGRLRPEQAKWLAALGGYIIRPSSLEWLANKLKEASRE